MELGMTEQIKEAKSVVRAREWRGRIHKDFRTGSSLPHLGGTHRRSLPPCRRIERMEA